MAILLTLAPGRTTPLAQSAAAEFRNPDLALAAYERRDFRNALGYWLPRAEGGDARAQTWIGVMYLDGQGVRQDAAEAMRWLARAAAQDYGEASYRLGVIHHFGHGVTPDTARAVRNYRAAAERGHVMAQITLSEMYVLGVGVGYDLVRAHMWGDIAAGLARGEEERFFAEGNRETAAEMMTQDQITLARNLARAWRERRDRR